MSDIHEVRNKVNELTSLLKANVDCGSDEMNALVNASLTQSLNSVQKDYDRLMQRKLEMVMEQTQKQYEALDECLKKCIQFTQAMKKNQSMTKVKKGEKRYRMLLEDAHLYSSYPNERPLKRWKSSDITNKKSYY